MIGSQNPSDFSIYRKHHHNWVVADIRETKCCCRIAAAIINASKADISRGAYRHLGIHIKNGELVCPEILYPENLSGLYARRNRDGIEWKLKDLPKITKTYTFDSPNFGDPDIGYHTTTWYREVFQRRLEPRPLHSLRQLAGDKPSHWPAKGQA